MSRSNDRSTTFATLPRQSPWLRLGALFASVFVTLNIATTLADHGLPQQPNASLVAAAQPAPAR